MSAESKIENPKSPEEWQVAVDMAEFLLYLASARQYGLVDGGPVANIKRCEDILHEGARRGFKPAIDAVERCTAALVLYSAKHARG